MKSTTRALAMALSTISLLILPAAGHAATSQTAVSTVCGHTYTLSSFRTAVTRAYAGVKPSRARVAQLEHMLSCQRRSQDMIAARALWERTVHEWRNRQVPPASAFSESFVSYYDDWTGQTASGVHEHYGFAACGEGDCVPMFTRIEFCNAADRSRCVVAIRDDSGPYVAGRAFDLNQNTAAAIGFDGLGDVYWRVVH